MRHGRLHAWCGRRSAPGRNRCADSSSRSACFCSLATGYRASVTVSAGERRRPISRFQDCAKPSCRVAESQAGGCGKKHGLARARTAFDDAAHVGQKTHVEHAVRFIQDENLDLIEPNHSALHLIEQAARRSRQDIRALTQRLVLPAVTRAAEKNRRAQIGEAAIT